MRHAPAGQVLPTEFINDTSESELRIASDFDGILADDSAEAIFKSSGLAAFHDSEAQAAAVPILALAAGSTGPADRDPLTRETVGQQLYAAEPLLSC